MSYLEVANVMLQERKREKMRYTRIIVMRLMTKKCQCIVVLLCV
jgi:hypothetical protein